ncbi:conjugal transfer protein TraB [Kitasatospora sp. RG8]|uniref:conjugal transfer protein TraB n=1 Tax=Kitasatospora sp. RG8 TaxID=2820815 RepID=UPI001ADF71A3|nr:conjugal transfer protein TraB [Kitasatospora sp. RG8]MBP0453984.1 conjugal transfer protein TraB [Kitasatospora sp. RG8]
MSGLDVRAGGVPVPTDGDNRFKSVQHKLKTLATAMDGATVELETLRMRIHANGERAGELAERIAAADLDAKFVEMTNIVSLALGGAAVDIRTLHDTAQEVAAQAHDTQVTHAKLYGALDEVRASRSERTPKPGFFNR